MGRPKEVCVCVCVIGCKRHMQRYFSYVCDDLPVKGGDLLVKGGGVWGDLPVKDNRIKFQSCYPAFLTCGAFVATRKALVLPG